MRGAFDEWKRDAPYIILGALGIAFHRYSRHVWLGEKRQLLQQNDLVREQVGDLQCAVEILRFENGELLRENSRLDSELQEMEALEASFAIVRVRQQRGQHLERLQWVQTGDLAIPPPAAAAAVMPSRHVLDFAFPRCMICLCRLGVVRAHNNNSNALLLGGSHLLPVSCRECPKSVCRACLVEMPGDHRFVRCPNCQKPACFDTAEPTMNYALYSFVQDLLALRT